MNQTSPCRYRFIPQKQKFNIFLEVFWKFLDVLVVAWVTRKKLLGQHNFFSKDLVKKRIISPQS
jgi:hypothetical protein